MCLLNGCNKCASGIVPNKQHNMLCQLKYSHYHASLFLEDKVFLPRGATQSASVRPSVLSVCLSVTFRYRDHISWNKLTSKEISRLISLGFMLGLTPTSAIWSNGNTPKLGCNRVRWNRAGVQKTCNISETV